MLVGKVEDKRPPPYGFQRHTSEESYPQLRLSFLVSRYAPLACIHVVHASYFATGDFPALFLAAYN